MSSLGRLTSKRGRTQLGLSLFPGLEHPVSRAWCFRQTPSLILPSFHFITSSVSFAHTHMHTVLCNPPFCLFTFPISLLPFSVNILKCLHCGRLVNEKQKRRKNSLNKFQKGVSGGNRKKWSLIFMHEKSGRLRRWECGKKEGCRNRKKLQFISYPLSSEINNSLKQAVFINCI